MIAQTHHTYSVHMLHLSLAGETTLSNFLLWYQTDMSISVIGLAFTASLKIKLVLET